MDLRTGASARVAVTATMAGLLFAGRLDGAETRSPAGSAYDALISPILHARCVECHGEKKRKAELALHSWETLTRGSDAGPVIVAAKPEESVLLERLRLPLNDEEHMPPEDQPQPEPGEIALLEHWIARGASPTATIAELELPRDLARAAADLPAKLAAALRSQAAREPIWEFDPATVAKARGALAEAVADLQRRFPGALTYESRTSAALHFTAVGFGRDFGDVELAELAPIAGELQLLDVSGTSISDKSAGVLATFKKLRLLRAGFTDLGDAAAAAIATLPRLELLALPGTRVTANGAAAFGQLGSLRTLRLAETDAQRSARAAADLPIPPAQTGSVGPESK